MNFKPALSCRGCLSEVQPKDAHSFSWPEIRDLFRDCTSLPIPMEERELPQQICDECYTKCEQWYSFRTMCHEIDTHLRTMPQTIKTEIKLEPISIDSDDEEEEELNFGELELDEDEDDLEDAEPVFLAQKIKLSGSQDSIKDTQSTTMSSQEDNSHWICPVCESLFPQTTLLRDHFMEHVTENDPHCPTCYQQFNRSSKVYPHFLSEHMNQKPKEPPRKAPAIETSVKKAARRTNQTIPPATTKAGQQCPLCPVKTNSLSSHIEARHVRSGTFECPLCYKTWTSNIRLMDHLNVHTGEKPFQCSTCPNKYAKKSNLNAHVRDAHGSDVIPATTFECSHCPSAFQSKWTFDAHQILHCTSEKPHQCAYCEAGYTEVRNIEKHMKKNHDDELAALLVESSEPLSCPECDVKFNSPWNLITHMALHTDKCACPDCGKRFIQISNMRDHQRIMQSKNDKVHRSVIQDTRYAPFKKSYVSSPGVQDKKSAAVDKNKSTMAIRIKKSPSSDIVCPHCKRTCKTRSSFNKHLIREHGQKELPHNCKKCGKRFSTLAYLKRHQITHSDVKPFGCRYCGKRFHEAYYSAYHEKNHCKVRRGATSD